MVIQIRPDEGKLIVEFPYSPERVKKIRTARRARPRRSFVSWKELGRIRSSLDRLDLASGREKKRGDERRK